MMMMMVVMIIIIIIIIIIMMMMVMMMMRMTMILKATILQVPVACSDQTPIYILKWQEINMSHYNTVMLCGAKGHGMN